MQRGIGSEPFEVFGFARGAVFRDPVFTAREFFKAQHIEHAVTDIDGAKEMRMFGDAGAGEQAAIRIAHDAEMGAAGIVMIDQPMGGVGEIVKHVLLVLQHARLMPGLAIDAAAAQIGHGIDPAEAQPGCDAGAEIGRDGDIEPAIAIEDGWVFAVKGNSLPRDDEHRHAHTAGGLIENLLDAVVIWVERHGGSEKHGFLARSDVIADDFAGAKERGEAEIDVFFGIAGGNTADRAGLVRQLDRADQAAAGGVEIEPGFIDHHAMHENFAIGHVGGIEERVFLFGHHDAPIGGGGMVNIDGGDAAKRGFEIGLDEHRIALGADRDVGGVILGEKRADFGVELGVIGVAQARDIKLVAGGVEGQRDEQITAILRNIAIDDPFAEVRPAIDERILRLMLIDPVVVERLVFQALGDRLAFGGLGVARVEKALAVMGPADVGEFYPAHRMGQGFVGRDIEHIDCLPVRAALGQGVRHVFAVWRGGIGGERGATMVRKAVRVEQDMWRAGRATLHIEHGLVLDAGIAAIKQQAAALERGGLFGVVPEFGELCIERGAEFQAGEIMGGELILCGNPGGEAWIGEVFHPLIGRGNFGAEIIIHNIVAMGRRIGECCGLGAISDPDAAEQKRNASGATQV